MPVERFYIEDPLTPSHTLFLQGEEYHHLSHVLRIKPKELVEIVNGQGSLAQARVEFLEKNRAVLYILSSQTTPPPSYKLILAQAMPRQPRLEYILEKSVELGVTHIWLFPGMQSEKKEFSPSQIDRMRHIMIAATKQCGRLYLPQLVLAPELLAWDKKELPSGSFFGDLHPQAPSLLSSLQKPSTSHALIAIGPEKGFHSKEIAHMKDSLHMTGVHLHAHILRTDTAAICALSICSALLIPPLQ